MIDQRSSLIAVDTETGADGLFVVISATAGQHALHDDVFRNLVVNNTIEGLASFGKQVSQDVSLLNGAWETIQKEAFCSIGLSKAGSNHTCSHVGWNQLASVDVLLGLDTQRGTLANVGAEKIASRNVRNAKLLRENCSLGALTSTGRSEEYESHYFRSPS
ncbi:hypothetical protein cgR_0669 [Corynebacterium glutamicum R]|uniref:Uncharacterized protein n=1 Tax=Corynebacterium glutamicum (strain R) TaxID=340322 RepID=A0AB72V8H8_CORGB|nr:hypothetical protein cgR_0669 [Corynebacterium glutamicum R]